MRIAITALLTVMVFLMNGGVEARPGGMVDDDQFGSEKGVKQPNGDEVIELPYYGGATGQKLQIIKKPDGTVTSEIIKTNEQRVEVPEVTYEDNSFEFNLKAIQKAATELVALQQSVRATGKLTEKDQQLYAANLAKLGLSAQKLANIQVETGQEDFRLLFQGALGSRGDKPSEVAITTTTSGPPRKEGEEENVGEEVGGGGTPIDIDDNDSIQVNVPDKDASVAEAKPVGLAIAGEGGVAASKPVATAVVGPGGLAIARPVATAIAGIEPGQLGGLGLPVPSKVKANILTAVSFPLKKKKKYGLVDDSLADGIGLLVGPEFDTDAHLSDLRVRNEIAAFRKGLTAAHQEDASDMADSDEPIHAEPEDGYAGLESPELSKEKLNLALAANVARHRLPIGAGSGSSGFPALMAGIQRPNWTPNDYDDVAAAFEGMPYGALARTGGHFNQPPPHQQHQSLPFSPYTPFQYYYNY